MTAVADDRPILVTGATGFIGLEVVRQLAAIGAPVRATFRRQHRAALLAQLDVELVQADLRSGPSLERAVAGCRAIVHLAGRATFEPYERLAPTIVHGTADLVAAAERADVDRLVFASSLFVHGADDGPTVTSSSPTNPVIGYGRAKIAAEEIVAEASLAGGALSVRLPHVYGWNDLLFGLLRTGYLPFPGDTDLTMAHLHIEDCARALIAAVDSPLTGPLPIADEVSVSWKTFFEIISMYLPTARIVRIPPSVALPIADVLGRVLGRRDYPSMIHGDTIRGWNLELRVPPGSLTPLGLTCSYPSAYEGIPAVLDAAMPYRWRHPAFDRRGV